MFCFSIYYDIQHNENESIYFILTTFSISIIIKIVYTHENSETIVIKVFIL